MLVFVLYVLHPLYMTAIICSFIGMRSHEGVWCAAFLLHINAPCMQRQRMHMHMLTLTDSVDYANAWHVCICCVDVPLRV